MAKKTNYSKNGIDYYRVTATVGFDPNGKRIRKEFWESLKRKLRKKETIT